MLHSMQPIKMYKNKIKNMRLITLFIFITTTQFISSQIPTPNHSSNPIDNTECDYVYLIDNIAFGDDINPIHATTRRASSVTYKGKYFRTYFVYIGDVDLRTYVKYYDNDTGEYSEPVDWGIPLVGAIDIHALPCIHITRDGRIWIVQEKLNGPNQASLHNSPHHFRRSDNSEDISTWTRTHLLGQWLSYPSLVNVGKNKTHFFARLRVGKLQTWFTQNNGDDWYDLSGRLIQGTSLANNGTTIVDLTEDPLRLRMYYDAYELEDAMMVVVRPWNNSAQGKKSHNYSWLIFSFDGKKWGNFDWYLSKGETGKSKDVSLAALNLSDLENGFKLSGGDGTVNENKMNGYVSRPFIVNDHLVFTEQVGHTQSAAHTVGRTHVFTDQLLVTIDRYGNRVEKSIITNSDLTSAQLYTPHIFPYDCNKIKLWINPVGNGDWAEYMTYDEGDTWVKTNVINTDINNGAWNNTFFNYNNTFKLATISMYEKDNPTVHRLIYENLETKKYRD